jgi:hypothetical protein
MKDGEEDQIKVAIKILSMSKDDVEDALTYVCPILCFINMN